MMEIFASIFQRADSAELKSTSSKVPEFKDMKVCKTSPICPNCNGIRYSIYDNRTILMLPQPTSTGKAYSYSSDEPRNVKDLEQLTIDLEEIQKGLHYASLGSGIDNFEESKKVLFTPHFHTRLQYYGNDPALVMDLWKSDSSDSSDSRSASSSGSSRFECNLQGPPPKNSVPALIGTGLDKTHAKQKMQKLEKEEKEKKEKKEKAKSQNSRLGRHGKTWEDMGKQSCLETSETLHNITTCFDWLRSMWFQVSKWTRSDYQ